MDNMKDEAENPRRPSTPIVRLNLKGDNLSTRQGLRELMDWVEAIGLAEADRAMIEIVLAEVLNNVVEHAFPDFAGGIIEIDARLRGRHLVFSVFDNGVPMPAEQIPQGKRHNLAVPLNDLPEGGFGWGIIRDLAEDLEYQRADRRNELYFRIPLTTSPLIG